MCSQAHAGWVLTAGQCSDYAERVSAGSGPSERYAPMKDSDFLQRMPCCVAADVRSGRVSCCRPAGGAQCPPWTRRSDDGQVCNSMTNKEPAPLEPPPPPAAPSSGVSALLVLQLVAGAVILLGVAGSALSRRGAERKETLRLHKAMRQLRNAENME